VGSSGTIVVGSGNSGGALAISFDGGHTWPRTQSFGSVAVPPGDIGWLGSSNAAALFEGYFGVRFQFDPSQSNVLYGAGGEGVFYYSPPTSGSGTSTYALTSQSTGWEGLVTTVILCPQGVTDGPVLFGWDIPIFKSLNPAQYPATYGPFELSIMQAYDADYAGGDPTFMSSLVNLSNGYPIPFDDVSSYSTDGGNTWTYWPTTPGQDSSTTTVNLNNIISGATTSLTMNLVSGTFWPQDGECFVIETSNPNNWFQASVTSFTSGSMTIMPYQGAWRGSGTAISDWTINGHDFVMPGGSIAVADDDHWIVAQCNGGFFRTADGGNTWVSLTEYFNTNFGYATTGNQGWTAYGYYLRRRTLVADKQSIGTFYAYQDGNAGSGSQGFWKSSDYGATWTQVSTGSPGGGAGANFAGNVQMIANQLVAGDLIFCWGSQGIPNPDVNVHTYRSLDGGATWNPLANVQETHYICFGPIFPGYSHASIWMVGWISGVYGVWVSKDNAMTWTNLGNAPVGIEETMHCITADMTNVGVVYLGTGGRGFLKYGPLDPANAALN
jgi:hypothetical protein